jgi:Ni,Fe-hydrogenase III small subunit
LRRWPLIGWLRIWCSALRHPPAAEIQRLFGRSLHLRHRDAGSCNGCDWELTHLLNPVYDVRRLGIDFGASPRHADGVVVTGSVTRNLEAAVRRTVEAIPEPRLVIAMGACAISGGIAGEGAAKGEAQLAGVGPESRLLEVGLSIGGGVVVRLHDPLEGVAEGAGGALPRELQSPQRQRLPATVGAAVAKLPVGGQVGQRGRPARGGKAEEDPHPHRPRPAAPPRRGPSWEAVGGPRARQRS